MQVAFCGLMSAGASYFRNRRYSIVKVGDEALINLESSDALTRQWPACRIALNRARRRGVVFDWVQTNARTDSLLEALAAVSRDWLRQRPWPEFSFAMSTAESLRDPLTRLCVARRPDGQIDGFVTWLPMFAVRGWALDMMRRRTGSMPGLMDFLIVRSLCWMQQGGYRQASLGGTPLSNVGGPGAGLLRAGMDIVFNHLSLGYRFKSLLKYKQKFEPEWKSLYLACQPGASLTRASYAVFRAVASELRPRHILKAAASTVPVVSELFS